MLYSGQYGKSTLGGRSSVSFIRIITINAMKGTVVLMNKIKKTVLLSMQQKTVIKNNE